jgi:uncharacterized coiled-coil protein SlyX
MEETQMRQPQRGLTFEDVWAAMMETERRFRESKAEYDRKFRESKAEYDRKFQESKAEYDRKFQESKAEHDRMIAEHDRMIAEHDRMIADMNRTVKKQWKNIGGMTKTLGRLTEEMYSARLWDKFGTFGYGFTSGCRNKKFVEQGQPLAQVDIFLENGLYAMPVEIKTDLVLEDVDDHLERIAKIRGYMDRRGDKRTLVGAVAGGIAPENVIIYAQKKGLYVVVQNGKSATVADSLPSFRAKEWKPENAALLPILN